MTRVDRRGTDHDLLRHTFIHLPGVGPVTELQLWQSGVTTWEGFLDATDLPPRVRRRRDDLCSLLDESQDRLARADGAFFASRLPGRERWRLYADFRDRAAFLDIETTGLSPGSSQITMVGILDSEGYKAYFSGENLEELREGLERYDLVVTFNGAAFDLPYIEYEFGRLFGHMAHMDLLYPLRQLGFRGGLKSIEYQLDMSRPSDLGGLDGFDAVLLWQMWREGQEGAKDTLARYNAEDVASLPGLAEFAYNGLASRQAAPCRLLQPSARTDIDLPYDMEVVSALRLRRASNAFWGPVQRPRRRAAIEAVSDPWYEP